jgi:hypothetical protein
MSLRWSLFYLPLFVFSILCSSENISSHVLNTTVPNTSSFRPSPPVDQDRMKQQKKVVESALHSISTEYCDWRISPLLYLKGTACGKYYKILNFKTRVVNQTIVRKRYHQMSKLLHPDKNPTTLATDAFRVLTESYECLMNLDCKESYDSQLRALEYHTFALRTKKLFDLKSAFQRMLFWTHQYLSMAATFIDQGNLPS